MGDKMTKMGFGMMRLPQIDKYDASDVDVEQVKQMVDIYIENGGNYFDTTYPAELSGVYPQGHTRGKFKGNPSGSGIPPRCHAVCVRKIPLAPDEGNPSGSGIAS